MPPLSSIIFFASTAFVPCRRTIIGILMLPRVFVCFYNPGGYTITRYDTTKNVNQYCFYVRVFHDDFKTSLNGLCIGVPPTSRMFTGSPPLSFIISIVAMARPAPFTIQPALQSSFTKFRLYFPASTSVGSSSVTSLKEIRSAWRTSTLSSTFIWQSTATTLSSHAL